MAFGINELMTEMSRPLAMIDETHPRRKEYGVKFSELMDYCRKEMGWLPEASTEEGRLIHGQAWLVMDELCRRLAKMEATVAEAS